MMHLKEKKEMDDAFKKAQKPWAKLLQKVVKAKSDYYAACKAEKTAVNQERNASGDSALSQDQVRWGGGKKTILKLYLNLSSLYCKYISLLFSLSFLSLNSQWNIFEFSPSPV